MATAQHKTPIDAMLDLALAEDLETTFEDSTTQGDEQAVKEIFCNPNVLLGQSDAGAHVASGNPGFGFATLMLAYWVRERKLMTLEDAIKKMTFLAGVDLRHPRPRFAAPRHGRRLCSSSIPTPST